MAQKGGPDIPTSGIQLLLDARNPTTLNASGWNSLVTNCLSIRLPHIR